MDCNVRVAVRVVGVLSSLIGFWGLPLLSVEWGMQSAKGAQRGNGQWLPDYAASPNRACLGKEAQGPSVTYFMPAGRSMRGGWAGERGSVPPAHPPPRPSA